MTDVDMRVERRVCVRAPRQCARRLCTTMFGSFLILSLV